MYTVYINHSERWSSPSGSFATKKGGNHRDLRLDLRAKMISKRITHEAKHFCRKISYHCNRQKEAWSWKLLQAEKWGLQFTIFKSDYLIFFSWKVSWGYNVNFLDLVVFSGSYDGRHPNGLADISASCMARCDHGGPSWLGRWKKPLGKMIPKK